MSLRAEFNLRMVFAAWCFFLVGYGSAIDRWAGSVVPLIIGVYLYLRIENLVYELLREAPNAH